MGVAGLWKILEGVSRPVKLETLAKKRLAVDASIWIYQFLKAVRDKEGNALRNSHIVGFFRRICKLLFFGIKPVFVFDGGAPILKRRTIANRKSRLAGRREDAIRTAGQILTKQMQRKAEQEVERQNGAQSQQGDQIPENVVYFGELSEPVQAPQKPRFRKKDQYHLPDLSVPLDQLGPNDPRVMSQQELQDYAAQFRGGEDINLYDFSKLDFDSEFFRGLPAADQYSILNAGRLRSRLRMGLSKEQLNAMFPNRLDFSKFQIERVKERNEFTQRLMNLNSIHESSAMRVAAEKGRQYVLVKNDGADGGWALGIVSGGKEKPVILDEDIKTDPSDDDGLFEDIPLEESTEYDTSFGIEKAMAPDGAVHSRPTSQVRTKAKSRIAPSVPLFQEDDEVSEHRDRSEERDLERAIQLSLQKDGAVHLAVEKEQRRGKTDQELDFAIAMSLQQDTEDQESEAKSPPNYARNAFVIEGEEDEPFSRQAPRTIEPLDKVPENVDFDQIISSTVPVKKPTSMKEKAGAMQPYKRSRNEAETTEKVVDMPPWFGVAKMTMDKPLQDREVSSRPFPKAKKQKSHEARHSPLADMPLIANAKEREKSLLPEPLPLEESNQPLLQPRLDISSEDESREVGTAESPEVDRKYAYETAMDSAIHIEGTPEAKIRSSADSLSGAFVEPSREPADAGSKEHEDSNPLTPIGRSSPPSNPQDVQAPPTLHHEGSAADDTDLMEEEEEALIAQMAAEVVEHERFAGELNSTVSNTAQRQEDYERDLRALRSQQKKDRRDADEVTSVMIQECQELLRLFGLPYITAPMEAEAQCAELVNLGLVDGIVTDDSDIFLFGGTRVYKNLFNQAKVVECYLASDLEREFDIDRHKLIRLAQLLGSDYAEGLPHVGPVVALELLSEFNSEDGLERFRDWWHQVQSGQEADEEPSSAFRKKFRKQATKIFLPPSFPDAQVDQAYLRPEFDSDPSAFEWGIPDLDALRTFLMTTIGWSKERMDEILVPVIRDMNRRQIEGTQANLTDFFNGTAGTGVYAPRRKDPIKSKRLNSALLSLKDQAKRRKGEDTAEARKTVSRAKRKTKAPDEIITIDSDDDEEEVSNSTSSGEEERIAKRPKQDAPKRTTKSATRGSNGKRKTR